MALTVEDNNDDDIVAKQTMDYVESLTQTSPFFKRNPPIPLPCYTKVELGVILGQGEFGIVREVTGFPNINDQCSKEEGDDDDLSQNTLDTYTKDDLDESNYPCACSLADEDNKHDNGYNVKVSTRSQQQHDLGKRCWRNGMARYAVKGLQDDIQDQDLLQAGLIDLAMEAKFLASLSHSNIVKLRGTIGVTGQEDFMLILDRLYWTLGDKVSLWKAEQRRIRTRCLFGMRKKRFQSLFRDFMIQRLVVAYDIARVFKYLHEKNIMYRDLKPENIGYDIRDDLRIFDFGIAKELRKEDLVSLPEGYNLTGLTGSRRWMAPEVYECLPYGPSADVYSFGLLFWNIFSLKTPFAKMSLDKHHNDVIVNNKRPVKLPFLPESLDIMMRHSWSTQRETRPSFQIICSILRCELEKLQTRAATHLHDDLLDRTIHLETKSASSMDEI